MGKWIKLTAKGQGQERDREVEVNTDNICFVAAGTKMRGEDGSTKITFVGGNVLAVGESPGLIAARRDDQEERAWAE